MKTTAVDAPASLRTVAQKAGVSISTVSRVVNGKVVNANTMEKVQKIVDELGYTPMAHAQDLRRRKPNVLGLLLTPEVLNIEDELIVATMLSNLIQAAVDEDYWIIPESLALSTFAEHTRPEIVAQGRVSGLFLLGTLEPEAVDDILGWNLPVCLLDDYGILDPRLLSVGLDFAAGSQEVMQYLTAMGHRRIALVHGDMKYRANQGKQEGYLTALHEFGLPRDPALMCEVPRDRQNYAGGFEATRQLLALDPPPSAIYYVNDWFAVGGLAAALQAGLKVPEDLSIVGCDDSFMARQCTPALTSMGCDYPAFTRTALDLLVRRMAGRSVPDQPFSIRPHLVRRGSCSHIHQKNS